MLSLPKIRLLYYKNALDRCVRRFFDSCEDGCFSRDGSDRYVFSGSWAYVERRLSSDIADEIRRLSKPFDIMNPSYTFIIGGCCPAENMLLDHAVGGLPKKLRSVLDSGSCPKYILRERDIVFDPHSLSDIADRIFEKAFRHGFRRVLGPGYGNVFAIRHRRLDCYAVFKALKYVYGRSACVNVWKEEADARPQCLTAVNDLIDLYVNSKAEMNRSPEFKTAIEEIRQYADGCIRSLEDGERG